MAICRGLTVAISIVMTGLVMAGCASNADVQVLKPVKSDTLSQKTYAWARGSVLRMAPKGFGEVRATALSEAIIDSLAAKGYVLTGNPHQADLLVSTDVDGEFDVEVGQSWTHGNLANTRLVNTPYQRNVPAARRRAAADRVNGGYTGQHAGKVIEPEVEGTVIIDIRDRATRTDLWQGRIRKTIALKDAEAFGAEIGDDVSKLFKDFPVSAAD